MMRRGWLSASLLAVVACGGLACVGVACSAAPPAEPATPKASPTQAAATSASVAEHGAPLFEASVPVGSGQEPVQVGLRSALEWLVGPAWAAFVRLADVQFPPASFRFDAKKRVVHVRLEAPAVAALLDEFEQAPLGGRRPPAWAELLEEYASQERSVVACRRRQELLAQPCIPFDTGPFRLRVAGLAERAVLQPLYVEGVPTDSSGNPLRPARLRVFESSDAGLLTVAGAPLSVRVANDTLRSSVVSDAEGGVELEHPGHGELNVTFDAAELLGPASAAWNTEALRVVARPVQHARTALVSIERARGADSATTVVADALLLELRRSWGPKVAMLPAPWSDRVRSGQTLDPVFSASIADGLRGAYDFLLIVESASEFASQMGQERVWFEARANVRYIDLWGGGTLQQFDERLTASGIGEERAEHGARRDIGAKVAQLLVSHEARRTGVASATPLNARHRPGAPLREAAEPALEPQSVARLFNSLRPD